MLLAEPPPTRYDLRFSLFGIPIRVHPLFWLMGILLGASSGSLISLLLWILAVFVSILFHELGHAVAMRIFDRPSRIVLHLMGGLTIPEGTPWMGRWANVALGPTQEILISLAGPGAGFLLAALVILVVSVAGGLIYVTPLLGILPMPGAVLPNGGRILNEFILYMMWINVFWGLVNLIPVLPLDGGNVAHQLFVQADPLDGARKSLWLSVIAGAIAALGGFMLFRSFYILLLFGSLAFESYQRVQGSRW
jgi:stage IV sporulation protein FB